MKKTPHTIAHLFACCICCLGTAMQQSTAQELWSASGNTGTTTMIDFAIGETVVAYTQYADIGYLTSLYLVSGQSNTPLIPIDSGITVTFYPMQEKAIITLPLSVLSSQAHYDIYDTSGMRYLYGEIDTTPFDLNYSQLPAGIYIIRVSTTGNYLPHTARWVKNR